MLRADLTDDEDATVKKLEDEFDIKGLPCIVFLDSSGKEIRELRLTGYEKPAEFAARLRCANSIELAQNS